MKIDYCYHTHTYRCGHAQGSDEEYVIEASTGIYITREDEILGFEELIEKSDRLMYEEKKERKDKQGF